MINGSHSHSYVAAHPARYGYTSYVTEAKEPLPAFLSETVPAMQSHPLIDLKME